MSYQTAAELEKEIISSFGEETDDAWVFSSGQSDPAMLVKIERADIRLKAAQMRERIQRRLVRRARVADAGGADGHHQGANR